MPSASQPDPDAASSVAVVTGGSMGTGHAIAARLLLDGHHVAVLDIAPPDEPLPGSDHVHCDVSDRTAVKTAIDQVAERHGRIDVLVNNAGLISPRKSYLESDEDELLRYFRVNAVGYVLTVQAAHDWLVTSERGAIVNVASRTFFTGSPGQLGYVASKGAVLGLTRVLAKELGAHGVTVNAVMPGQLSTPGTRQYLDEEDFDRTMMQQAIKRRVQPEDLADLVSFLAGEHARMITGQTIVCDGGGFLH